MEKEYKSTRSSSTFVARGDKERAYLIVHGEASTKAKVLKEIQRIQREGGDFATVDWIARQMANTY